MPADLGVTGFFYCKPFLVCPKLNAAPTPVTRPPSAKGGMGPLSAGGLLPQWAGGVLVLLEGADDLPTAILRGAA